MERFIALYRGINVGGNNPVKMEPLRAMHEALGHGSVASYIQSGNIAFAARGSTERIARALADRFSTEFGFDARVMVVAAARWGAIVRANPYAKVSATSPKTVHAGICDGEPSVKGLRELHTRTGAGETFAVRGGVVYLHTPDGLGKSKFAAGLERACGVPMTIRNWRTVEALRDMLDAPDAAPARGRRGD